MDRRASFQGLDITLVLDINPTSDQGYITAGAWMSLTTQPWGKKY